MHIYVFLCVCVNIYVSLYIYVLDASNLVKKPPAQPGDAANTPASLQYVCVCMHVCFYINACIYVHIYTYIHTHKQTHTQCGLKLVVYTTFRYVCKRP